jgi:hypothetical protein
MTPSEKRIDMTPVEKANELVNKMFNCDKFTDDTAMAMLYPHALQCARIAVEEIMDLGLHDVGDYRNDQSSSEDFSTITWYINYWEEVKHEIKYMYTKQLPK